jgi:dephospho-CoA kinase
MASHSQPLRSEPRLVVGITGRIGSGKTTVGKYLESHYGFQYLRYSAVLAEWRAKDFQSKSRLQEVGWEVMAEGMQAELNQRLLRQIVPERDLAVDGLRHPLDYQTLDNSFSRWFRLLFIASPPHIRFARLNQRGKYADMASFEAADSHPVEQHIDSLQSKAAAVIQNESSLDDLYAAVDDTIFRFRKEGRS